MTDFVPEAIQIINGAIFSFALLGIVTGVGNFLEKFMESLR